MSPEQAKHMAEFFVSVIEMETPTTRKIIAAVPEGKSGYRPDAKARSALELARHIPGSDIWFLEAVSNGEFGDFSPAAEEKITTVAGALKVYDEQFGPALDKVKALSGEKLANEISMMGMFNLPAVIYLSFLIRHTVHHRGQLSTYLRPMGSKVPSIYGGSADEPMEMPG
ncbi:MAG: hypothetical protein O2968_07870 [Acidobacteria bacterium]|nr:hypothetical protein [Acidobacteriota bacterium]